jgi:hypothetical protein
MGKPEHEHVNPGLDMKVSTHQIFSSQSRQKEMLQMAIESPTQ